MRSPANTFVSDFSVASATIARSVVDRAARRYFATLQDESHRNRRRRGFRPNQCRRLRRTRRARHDFRRRSRSANNVRRGRRDLVSVRCRAVRQSRSAWSLATFDRFSRLTSDSAKRRVDDRTALFRARRSDRHSELGQRALRRTSGRSAARFHQRLQHRRAANRHRSLSPLPRESIRARGRRIAQRSFIWRDSMKSRQVTISSSTAPASAPANSCRQRHRTASRADRHRGKARDRSRHRLRRSAADVHLPARERLRLRRHERDQRLAQPRPAETASIIIECTRVLRAA